jgi:hypothetical protein
MQKSTFWPAGREALGVEQSLKGFDDQSALEDMMEMIECDDLDGLDAGEDRLGIGYR